MLTPSVTNVSDKRLGVLQVSRCGLDKFRLPVKNTTVERDETKEVLFGQIR